MRKTSFILIAVVIAAFLGCNRQATPPDQNLPADDRNLAQEAEKIVQENQPTDDQVNTSMVRAMNVDPSFNPNDTNYAVYSILMVWGQIPPDPMDTTPVFNWSGQAYVNGVGRFLVLYPIAFERGYDSLLPVNNPTTIAWKSTTDSDVDGLSTLLMLRRDVQYVVEPHFNFKTRMASLDIPLSRLEKFDTLVIANTKQALVVRARRIVRPVCPAGTLAGEWVRLNNTGDSGTFHGTWNGPDGKPIGPLAGRFWTNNDGSRQFEGWWSQGMLTVIAGEIRGRWAFADPSMCPLCGNGMGEFHGKFVEVLGDKRTGEVHGVFGAGPGPGQNVMPFRGVWKAVCSNTRGQAE